MKKVILALGESSHTHVMTTDEKSEIKIIGDDIVIDLEQDSPVTHEEHEMIVIPSGRSTKIQQRQFNYSTQLVEKIVD